LALAASRQRSSLSQLLFGSLALADTTASGHVTLKGTYIEVGVNKAGFFGCPRPSCRRVPLALEPHQRPRVRRRLPEERLHQSIRRRLLHAGLALRGLRVQWVSPASVTRNYQSAGTGALTLPTLSLTETSTATTKSVVWVGEVTSGTEKLKVIQTYSFKPGDLSSPQRPDDQHRTATLSAVKFGREVDPDKRRLLASGSYSTLNTVVNQPGVAATSTKRWSPRPAPCHRHDSRPGRESTPGQSEANISGTNPKHHPHARSRGDQR